MSRYPSPNDVNTAVNDRQKQLEINRKKKIVEQYNKDIKELEEANDSIRKNSYFGIAYWENELNKATKLYKTTTDPETIVQAEKDIKKAKLEITKLNAKIYTNSEEIRILKIQRDAVFSTKETKKPITKKSDKKDIISEFGSDFSRNYKYNAPLVSSAYLRKGISADSMSGTLDTPGFPITAPEFTDAYNAWRGVTGGRGTIQMDRKYVRNLAVSQQGSVQNLDLQMYGFKFLYNPTTVSMAWGVQMEMSPAYESSGEDAFSPIASNLISSTIAFEIVLNRISDFNHLLEDGSIIGAYPYGEVDVPIEERKQIYDRGTMYDLEYFFRTINGPHSTFLSPFNGLTSDSGWLRPSSMELHLGAGMRYRIRINSVGINHLIFNDRMVPILSKVNFTCGRYNDHPDDPLTKTAGSGGGRVNSVMR
jgi:hypothetical protein